MDGLTSGQHLDKLADASRWLVSCWVFGQMSGC